MVIRIVREVVTGLWQPLFTRDGATVSLLTVSLLSRISDAYLAILLLEYHITHQGIYWNFAHLK